MNVDQLELASRNIAGIARLIRANWPKPKYSAVPYLDAMASLDTVNDSYGYDDGRGIILYFLSNASGWRGEAAREIKAELKRRIKR